MPLHERDRNVVRALRFIPPSLHFHCDSACYTAPVTDKARSPVASSRRSTQLRKAGIIVLLAGLLAAGLVYWLGSRSPDSSDDLSMLGFNRRAERQMGLLYGKMGTLIEDWLEDLKHPGVQAVLIIGFTVVVAAGCFYFARLMETDDGTS